MTYEEKLENVHKYKSLVYNLANNKEEKQKAYDSMTNVASKTEGYSGFNMFTGASKIEKQTSKIIAVEKRINKIEKEIADIENRIEKLSYRQKILVILVDFEGWKISKAARYIGMSYNAAFEMHKRAINKMYSE